MLTTDQKDTLLSVAHDSIQYGFTHSCALPINLADYEIRLQEINATFVTLNIHGELRGCIGILQPVRPLVEDVSHNAYAAAFCDRRFHAVSEAEFKVLDIHISILNTPTTLSFNTEQELVDQLQPGLDGLIIEDQGKRATFLPSVWESLPNKIEFLKHLKQKAGLPPNYWSHTLTAKKYSVESF